MTFTLEDTLFLLSILAMVAIASLCGLDIRDMPAPVLRKAGW